MRSLPKYVLESQNKVRFLCCYFMHALYTCVVFFHSSHALTSDVSIEETARAAEFFLSDGVIITGAATGVQANPEEFRGTVCVTVDLLSCNITLVRLSLVRKSYSYEVILNHTILRFFVGFLLQKMHLLHYHTVITILNKLIFVSQQQKPRLTKSKH